MAVTFDEQFLKKLEYLYVWIILRPKRVKMRFMSVNSLCF